jgi:hypothetical protein
MIRKSAYAVLLAMGCITAMAATASAATVGGEVFGAFSTHSMSDWNERLVAPVNAGGGNMDEFGNGFGGGLGLRAWPNSKWMLAATWEPLFVKREEKVSGDEANLKANAFEATAGYFFPSSTPAKFGLGAGIGVYSLGGEILTSTNTFKLEGSTVGFHVMGLMEWTVQPGFSITGSAGYRVADIKDTKTDNVSATPEMSTDYSGMMLRAGLAFYLPSLSK